MPSPRKSGKVARKTQSVATQSQKPEVETQEPEQEIESLVTPIYQRVKANPETLQSKEMLGLQSFVGNQAINRILAQRGGHQTQTIQRTPSSTIQRVRKTDKELTALKVNEFNTHRKAEQMDWANTTGLTDNQRSLMWSILEWGTGGLGQMTIDDIISEAGKDVNTMTYLKQYCDAVNGELDGQPTISLNAVSSLAEAKKQGEWVGKISRKLGGQLAKIVVPLDAFELLISDIPTAQKFLAYYDACQPIMQTPTGREIECFVELVKDEKADILKDYKPALPDIRNYHKFYKSSLDKLKDDKAKKDKPLTIILYSTYDHNGAFHRHSQVRKVIENTNIRVYLIEKTDLTKLQNLQKSEFGQIAADHGLDGKITQVMVAGHGNATLMELGGGTTEITKNSQTGQDEVSSKGDIMLHFLNKSYNDFWTAFFDSLVKNMDGKGGLTPKILLRACLTNSNSINTTKMKELLKSESVIDVDNKSVDPTTEENQKKIRARIAKFIDENGSLATVLGVKTGGKAKVLGANASITSATTGAIKETTGELDFVTLADPKVAAPKIEYVRHGKEPLGAIRAVIESWARDDAGCFKEMDDRVKDVVAPFPGGADDFIINMLYSTILTQYKKNILSANDFTDSAEVLHGLLAAGPECRAGKLNGDAMIQKHQAAFYGAISSYTTNKTVNLVMLQDWLQKDSSKGKEFVDLLGNSAFKRNAETTKLIDYALLGGQLTTLLGLGGASARGKILLALIGTIEKGQTDCKQYLVNLAGGVDKELPMDVKNELQGYSEELLRKKLGMKVELPPPVISSGSSGSSAPTLSNNVDTEGKGANNYYVEPMRSEVKKMTKAGMFDYASLRTAPDDNAPELDSFYWKKDFTIVGEVKKTSDSSPLGWYMLKIEDTGKVAYMRTKYF